VQFSVATPLEIITAIDRGDKVQSVAVIYQTAPLAFATLKSSNIDTPADFRGKVLGSKGGNNESKVKYRGLLTEYQIPENAVTIQDVDYTMDEADDLINKRADVVDLYRTDQPYLLKQKGVDVNLILPENFGISGYGDTLVTTTQQIEQNPERVKAFVQATLKGWEYALDNKEEALTIVDKYKNPDYADAERLKYILEQSEPLIRPTGDRVVGDMNFRIWDQTVKQAQNSGLVSESFDSTKVYTNQFLQ
jgi:NitT/TauT family transport system substrate-binding protein